MLVTNASLEQLRIGYSAAFNRGRENVESLADRVATTVPSSTGANLYGWLGAIPGLKKWIGEREIQKVSDNAYSIANEKFELTVGVPRDDIEDDNYGVYTPMMEAMGESTALHKDERVSEAVKNGFTEKCYDGQPFFSERHQVGSITYSNKGDAKLDAESFQAARQSIMSLKNEKGQPLNIVPNVLLVPPALGKEARMILEAELVNGTSNINKGLAEVVVWSQLADKPTQWYLLCTKRSLKPFIFQERRKAKFTAMTRETDENVFMRSEYLYGVDARDGVGYGFWQMAYGSTGTASSMG